MSRLLLLALACGDPDEGPAADGGAATTDGGADDTGPVDTGPSCTYLPPGARLDLQSGCADHLCGGTDYPTARSVLGEASGCMSSGDAMVQCSWGDLTVSFPDCDLDGQPDEAALCPMTGQSFWVHGDWDGASPEGLGLGVPTACWIEALGPQAGNHTWTWGEDPRVVVTVEPLNGPVESILMLWTSGG